MDRIRWRRDFLIPLTFVITMGFLALVLIQLDRQYYQKEKYEIIRQTPDKFLVWPPESISEEAKRALKLPADSVERKTLLERIEVQIREILQGEGPIYSFEIQDDQNPPNVLLKVSLDKFKSHNQWSNSLFFRDFSRKTDRILKEYETKPPLGRLVILYTTPLHSKEIEALTVVWRWRCVFIVIAFLAGYTAILKGILLPLRRVIACLERQDLVAPEILRRPGTLLERAYNNLARDASLTKLAESLRDRIAREAALDSQALIAQIPEDLRTFFGLRRVLLVTMRVDEGGAIWTVEKVYEGARDAERDAERDNGGAQVPGANVLGAKVLGAAIADYLKRAVASHPPSLGPDEWDAHLGEARSERGEAIQLFASMIDRREDPETITLLVILPSETGAAAFSPWWTETFRLVAAQVRLAIETLTAQRRLIFQEKSKANISLSRNLGHDLTNIIATGKLDLMTIRRFLNIPPEKWIAQPQKEEIFKTSLGSVLNNTRFLQEVVNIYRSFSFLSRPKFERVDARVLAQEIVELFTMSLSRTVRLETRMDDNVPDCLVEPRLVKLALFNLLANANDAIKRKTTPESTDVAVVTVTVRHEREANEVALSVADNGTGILNEEGRPATPAEMDRIFQLGYTTKQNDEGEGLGLNWVYTIISEFHGGRVVPRNRPEGGAEFTLYLRVDGPKEAAAAAATTEDKG